jgi:hypothetical protein
MDRCLRRETCGHARGWGSETLAQLPWRPAPNNAVAVRPAATHEGGVSDPRLTTVSPAPNSHESRAQPTLRQTVKRCDCDHSIEAAGNHRTSRRAALGQPGKLAGPMALPRVGLHRLRQLLSRHALKACGRVCYTEACRAQCSRTFIQPSRRNQMACTVICRGVKLCRLVNRHTKLFCLR